MQGRAAPATILPGAFATPRITPGMFAAQPRGRLAYNFRLPDLVGK